MKSICVYCGAYFNDDPVLLAAVQNLAEAMTSRNIKLVYGGGSVGVMGLIAGEVLKRDGYVTGVIPQFLLDLEVGNMEVNELIVTANMHERKQKMADLADGFVILPGGYGTLEEFFEVLTWLQLGLHQKAIGILNVGGYYDHLLAQLDTMVAQGMLKQTNRDLVQASDDPELLIELMHAFRAEKDENWFKDRNLS
ncbi:TIGR00730 family Rossman fold protein [Pedobacter antarcticus]|uniref:Cytokinin riboside 5'-monophosphate phosphoribohydrolase n=2 Tax=Pedobacter antarcticus TaxID=34086 RepID=A0A081PEW1_9SPHI|nr:TIGR00730 family Rossman fold protein [Pedobacter antarcticus]KEQ29234.1 LOG family protein YvdD [Pedobacter antarcticus 4BY]